MKKITTVLLFIVVIQIYCPKVFESNFIHRMFEIKTSAAMVDVSDQSFSVKTFVKGDDVYVECYVRDYRFTRSNKKETASIAVTIDDDKQSVYKTAAFILKDFSNGKHTIKLELVNENGKKIGLKKEFQVHIHSAV